MTVCNVKGVAWSDEPTANSTWPGFQLQQAAVFTEKPTIRCLLSTKQQTQSLWLASEHGGAFSRQRARYFHQDISY